MKLSVLMPVYNEERWIGAVIAKVLNQKLPGFNAVELIVVDDGSTDGTRQVIQNLADKHPQKIFPVFLEKNCGKGKALQTAIEKMSGDVCIVQDADLEYDPADYPLVLEPIVDGRADCVYGSRFVGSQAKRVLFFWHYMGNKFITLLSNIVNNLNLTDVETGYKAFKSEIFKDIRICSKGFGFEPEITAKIARRKYRIYEVGISYCGRNYQEGKKIKWFHGFEAIWTILYFWAASAFDKKASVASK